MKTRSSVPAALVGIAVGLSLWAPPAMASPANTDAAKAAGVVAKAIDAVGAGSETVPWTAAPAGVIAQTTLGEAIIPANPTNAITLGTGDQKLGVSLPTSGSAAKAELVDGKAVIADGETSFAVDALPDGLRIASVLKSKKANHSPQYRLSLPSGVEARLNSDGGVSLVSNVEGAEVSTAGFAAPWAVDAAGNRVETRYEISGNRLTQIVTPSPTAAYPIVADPRVSGCLLGGWWPAMCATYTRAETVAQYRLIAAGAGAAAAISEGCSKMPNLAAKAACKAGVALVAFAYINNLKTANDQGRCLQVRFTLPSIANVLTLTQVVNC